MMRPALGQKSADVFAVVKERDGFNPRGDSWRSTIRRALWFGPMHRSHQSHRHLTELGSDKLPAFDNSGRCSKVLCRPSVRGHRPEIMFGVLVVVFCPDCVSG
jgi:hypothetical protein